jgi:hypothetical protein
VARCQQNTPCRPPLSNNVARRWRAQDAIFTDEQLLYPIRSADLGNQLYDFRVVVTAISADDEERAFNPFWDREKYASDEGLAIVRLLEYSDLLAEARTSIQLEL